MTYDSSAAVTGFDFTTDRAYDSKGRITDVFGPRSGVDDDVQYTYYTTGADIDYLEKVKRQKGIGSTSYLETTFAEYDPMGRAQREEDPNTTWVCRTFNNTHHKIASQRQVIGSNPSTCASGTDSGGDDETTGYAYGKHGKTVNVTKPLQSCSVTDYGSYLRPSTVYSRRGTYVPTCTTTNQTKVVYTYDNDGAVTKLEWIDTDGTTVTRRQEYTCYPDTRRKLIKNPVGVSGGTNEKELIYDDDGVLAEVKDEDNDQSSPRPTTQFDVDALNRMSAVRRGTDSSTLAWTVTPGVQLDLSKSVADNHGTPKTITTTFDDMGRRVKEQTPNLGSSYPNVFVYDEAGNVIQTENARGQALSKVNIFTYDPQNRLTGIDTLEGCGSDSGNTLFVYDALGTETCPSGSQCNLLAGRLAVARVMYGCVYPTPQYIRNFYSYNDAGRIAQHTTTFTPGTKAKVTYTYDKDGNVTKIGYPLGTTADAVYSYQASGVQTDRVDKITRGSTSPTDYVTAVTWAPSGPWTSYLQGNTMYNHGSINNIKVTRTLNLAYRTSEILTQSTYSPPDGIADIVFGEDEKGRYTKRDLGYTSTGEADMYFTYDVYDRLTCRSEASGACPTSGAGVYENIVSVRRTA